MIKDFRDASIITELHEDEKRVRIGFIVIGIFIICLLLSIFYLVFLVTNAQKPIAANIVAPIQITSTPTPTVFSTLAPTNVISPTPIIIYKDSSVSVKDYYVYFGTGTNQTSEWVDVPGLQASIDFGNYQNIKEVRFETSVSVPTENQTVSIRLFNVSDKHPVWYSEVTTTNNVFTVSQPLIYDKGNKIYQVQMKTQLKYLATLTQARIHIILQ
ncbi:MAG: hypothetical protein M1365_03265 [Actinobacteria bacterium]|nr:hypothetical protein [Actinomycetota bacterium]